jgi:hypothetical protein
MIAWLKPLKVGKVERYSVDLTNFADGQTITAATFVSTTGLSTVGATVIDGTIISALFTGVTVGTDFIDIEYSTATRSDCLKPQLVIKDC